MNAGPANRKRRAAGLVMLVSLAAALGAAPDVSDNPGADSTSHNSGPSVDIGEESAVWTVAESDSIARRTDSTGYIPPDTLPELLSVVLSGWTPDDDDPFEGEVTQGESAHVFRMDVIFSGLVNPPGPIGLNGLPFTPHVFGSNPLYGFVEIDIDGDINTGGVLGSEVHHRYLSNVARFGGAPHGPTAGRAARWRVDRETAFHIEPFIERSGADFELALDGLRAATVLEVNGAPYTGGVFAPGDTWIVRGRFFQRSSGYQDASKMFGGSADGLYDPFVKLRFQHEVDPEDEDDGVTTVTLIYALDMIGAAMIEGPGTPVQPANYNVVDHTSIKEGMLDIMHSVSVRPLGGPVGTISNGWAQKNVSDHLDPTQWRITAIFGGTYSEPGVGRYIYSSVGFDMIPGDVNGDGAVDESDALLIQSVIDALDGTAADSSGVANGAVHLVDFADNFCVYDVNGDGVVDDADIDAVFSPIPGDLNGDGIVGSQDLGILLGSWGVCPSAPSSCPADINGDGVVNSQDLAILLGNWG